MRTSFLPISIVAMALAGSVNNVRAESLDFIAEHLIEIPMDFRYGAQPKSPAKLDRSEWRIDVGYGQTNAQNLSTRLPMLGVSRYLARGDGTGSLTGWLFSAFYDRASFTGASGPALMEPSFGLPSGLPESFPVTVSRVRGSGDHYGFGLSFVRALQSGARVQAGLIVERFRIGRYRIDFRTEGLASNFDGFVDYAGTYTAFTPIVTWEGARSAIGDAWTAGPWATFAWPLPRTGFKGRLVGPGFDIQGDTGAIGNGRHIPDPYLGLGVFVEQAQSGLRIELGASVFSYLSEPLIHKATDRSLFFTLSWRF